ncbi:TPA: hypothetical protein I7730_01195 [Vibrio vulnificus]|uniref:DNA helicase Pif1-like DEAD-box helicase domain-containing protein n=1 Tax=Vibrio vulnificus TaxID=672 RepID=A0A8H9K5D6_VIBVL|nr:AAA family ATPase [Vibrio vulnificus]HAS8538415.1 hypothetical protein [Vibrio vulnificus]
MYSKNQACDRVKNIPNEKLLILACVAAKKNIFLTGGGGVGKSYVIDLIHNLVPSIAVIAPTGISALNVNGKTPNLYFSLGEEFHLVDGRMSVDQAIIDKINSLSVLLIDEIGCLRPDTFDYINQMCKIAKRCDLPFGGLQIIVVGDFCQLKAPITKNTYGYDVFKTRYGSTEFAFETTSWHECQFTNLVLTEVQRQSEMDYIQALRGIRLGVKVSESVALINKRAGNSPKPSDIRLCATNKRVDDFNSRMFEQLSVECLELKGSREGEFPESACSVPEGLTLKRGCRVLLVANSNAGSYVNGDTGELIDYVKGAHTFAKSTDDYLTVKLDRNGEVVCVKRKEWQISEKVNGKKEVTGTYKQFPVKLGYAVSIHKSQGMTFDRLVLDLTNARFAPAIAYVGLSRVRSLAGLTLMRPLTVSDIIVSKKARDFTVQISKMALSMREQISKEIDFETFSINEFFKFEEEIVARIREELALVKDGTQTLPQAVQNLLNQNIKALIGIDMIGTIDAQTGFFHKDVGYLDSQVLLGEPLRAYIHSKYCRVKHGDVLYDMKKKGLIS